MNRKCSVIIPALLTLFFVALIFVGCGKGADGSKIGGAITFWLMPNAPDTVHKPWLDQKAADFEKLTGTKVTVEQVGWGDAWQRITTALATQEGVDVFQVGTTWNPQLAATNGLAEVDMKEFGGAESFMAANLESTTYKGKYYGIPWFAETRVLFYNKDIFAAVGVEPPKTHDELIEVAKKIVAKNGKGSAISLAGTNAWDLIHNWAIILWGNGGSLISADNKQAVFNTDAGVKAMKWYVDLVKNGYASEACAGYNQPEADAAFINGNVAMCYMGPWNIANIKNDNPTLNYGIVEPPVGPVGKASFSGGSNIAILKGTKNMKAAQAWANYLLKQENLVDYCKNLTNMLPAKVEAFSDPYYMEGNFNTFKTTLGYATAYPPLGVWGDIENAIVENFKNVLSDYVNKKYTEASAKTYLDKAAEKVNAALAKE
jgi:multiple sugar transport system substrate-binding protein